MSGPESSPIGDVLAPTLPIWLFAGVGLGISPVALALGINDHTHPPIENPAPPQTTTPEQHSLQTPSAADRECEATRAKCQAATVVAPE